MIGFNFNDKQMQQYQQNISTYKHLNGHNFHFLMLVKLYILNKIFNYFFKFNFK